VLGTVLVADRAAHRLDMYWPQRISETVIGWGLTPLGFVFA
jgi:hypothetical protein